MLPELPNFDATLGIWIDSLNHYSPEQWHWKPAEEAWSIGQVYAHLLHETAYYQQQIRQCLAGDQQAGQSPTAEGRALLAANSFPNRLLKGPPENPPPAQPGSPSAIAGLLVTLLADMRQLQEQVGRVPTLGKTAHPGFGYLNAGEWLRIAEMHLRHHLHQKKRLETQYRSRPPEA